MIRSTVVAALLAAQLAVLVLVVESVRGGSPIPAFARHDGSSRAFDARLIEGGAHRVFDAGAHPALRIDIGYADVTILPSDAAQIEVSLRPSTSPGLFQATGPITATATAGSVTIVAADSQNWSTGDDRMVTVLVPAETRVTVLAAGNVHATGLRAEASFKSVGSGSVTVDDYRAPKLHVVTTNGRIRLNDVVATQLDATGGDGRIEATALQVRDGDIESDGRVRLGFAAETDTRVRAQTDNGKVIVSALPPDTVDAPATDSADEDAPSRTVRIGNGDGHFNVHSTDGSITLARDG